MTLFDLLATILTVNGYQTNLGARLKFGPPEEAAEYGQDSLFLIPVSDRVLPENTRWTHRESWEIVAILYGDDVPGMMAKARADVWKCLGSNRTLGGTVQNMEPGVGGVEFAIATQGMRSVTLTFAIETLRRSGLWEP